MEAERMRWDFPIPLTLLWRNDFHETLPAAALHALVVVSLRAKMWLIAWMMRSEPNRGLTEVEAARKSIGFVVPSESLTKPRSTRQHA
jgi:hypothetical protein